MLRVLIGTGSVAKERAAKPIFGDALRRVSAILISRLPTSMVLAKTGRLITPRLPLGFRRPSDTWELPARFRTGQAIRMVSTCRRFRGAVLITSSKREAKKLGCRICLIVARN